MINDFLIRRLVSIALNTEHDQIVFKVNEAIIDMWKNKELPINIGKRWIVGYKLDITFTSVYCECISVGPKKPNSFRSKYASVKYQHIP